MPALNWIRLGPTWVNHRGLPVRSTIMELTISSTKDRELIDITQQVASCVEKSGIKNGLCHVYVRHATAGIVVNENADPNICTDLINALEKAIPTRNNYLHDLIDGNAAAHIKSALIGPSETLPIKNGKLHLGTWQSIMLVELDGPRSSRKISVSCLGH